MDNYEWELQDSDEYEESGYEDEGENNRVPHGRRHYDPENHMCLLIRLFVLRMTALNLKLIFLAIVMYTTVLGFRVIKFYLLFLVPKCDPNVQDCPLQTACFHSKYCGLVCINGFQPGQLVAFDGGEA